MLLAAIAVFASSFLLTLFITPILAGKLARRGITGKDMNKIGKPEIPELGGISPLLGLSFGIIVSIFFSTYLPSIHIDLPLMLASFLTIVLVGLIGVIDDLIGWRKGIRQWQHALLPVFAALPLMAVKAGTQHIVVPFVGYVQLGILYSLLLVPLAITGASNAFNMLAGLNGLESGLGILSLSTLSFIALLTGKTEAFIIGVAVVAALLAFLKYNWFPAKVFGGDSLTLMIGSTVATISIIGNMEKLGIFIIALHWVELGFKAKHRFQSESFGIPQKDGSLGPDPRGGSLTHFLLRMRRFTEQGLVGAMLGLQALVCIAVFLLFRFKLF